MREQKGNKDMNDERIKIIITRCIAVFFVLAAGFCAVLFFPGMRQAILFQMENFCMKAFQKPERWSTLLLLIAIFGICFAGSVGFLYFSARGNRVAKKLAGILRKNVCPIQNNAPLLRLHGHDVYAIVGAAIVFIGIGVFFIVVHPLIPWEGDDWAYFAGHRSALPGIGWVPGRMFPEMIHQYIGSIAAFAVYPLMHDYGYSLILTVGITLASLCAVFYWFLYRLFYSTAKDRALSAIVSLLVFVLYFAAFKTRQGSYHVLWSMDFTYAVWYTIPNLVNSILVCFFLRRSYQRKEISVKALGVWKFAFLLLVIYFAVFSCIFAAAIPVCYSFFCLVSWLLSHKKRDRKNLLSQNSNAVYCLIIVLFVFMFLFEAAGPRAQGAVSASSVLSDRLLDAAGRSALEFIQFIYRTHPFVVLFSTITTLTALLVGGKKSHDVHFALVRIGVVCLASALALAVFFIAVNAISNPRQSSRPEMMYGTFFFLFLSTALFLVYLILTAPRLIIFLPLVFVILFHETMNSNNRYAGYWEDVPALKKIELLNGWIVKIQQADKEGLTGCEIDVPKHTTLDGWHQIPLSYHGEVFARALYSHNITSKEMNVIVRPYDLP
jgi:hypothetical protein